MAAPRRSIADRSLPNGRESRAALSTWIGRLAPWLAMAALWLVALAFTPATNSLDDIKIPLFLGFGSVLLAAAPLLAAAAKWAPEDWALALLAGAIGLSAILARFHWIAWDQLRFLAAASGFYLAFAWGAKSERAGRAVAAGLLGLFAIQTAFALFHYAGGLRWLLDAKLADALFPNAPETASLAERLLSTFAHSEALLGTFLNEDFFAGYIAMTTPIAAAMALAARRDATRSLCLALALAGVFCVLVTMSKESVAALVVGLAIVGAGALRVAGALGGERWRVAAKAALGAAGTLALFGALALWFIWPRFLQELDTVGTAFSSRRVTWSGALGIWAEDPVFGAGPGGFRMAFPLHRARDYFEHEISNVTLFSHSLYFDALCETGLVGLSAFLAFLGAWAWSCWRAVANDAAPKGARVLCAGFGGAFVAAAIQNASSPWTRWPVGLTAFAATLGAGSALCRVVAAMGRGAEEPPPRGLPGRLETWRLAVAGVAGIMAAWCVYSGVQQFRAAIFYRQAVDEHALVGGEETVQNMRNAIRLYDEAADLNPTLMSATYRKASLQASLSHYEVPPSAKQRLYYARENFEYVESLWPNYAEAPLNRSILEGAWAAQLLAERAFLLEKNPEHDGDGALRGANDRLDEAIAQARRFQSWSDRYTAWRQLGDSLARKARFLAEFGKAIGSTESPSLYWLQACAAHDGALRAARRAQVLPYVEPPSPDDVELIRYNLLDALRALADAPDLAALDLSAIPEPKPGDPAPDEVAGFDLPGAMALLRSLEKEGETGREARVIVFLHQAASVAAELRREHPDRDDLAAEEIELWLKMGDADRAARAAWSQVRDLPLSPARWSDFALAADLAGRPDVAARAKARMNELLSFLGRSDLARSEWPAPPEFNESPAAPPALP